MRLFTIRASFSIDSSFCLRPLSNPADKVHERKEFQTFRFVSVSAKGLFVPCVQRVMSACSDAVQKN